MERQTITVDIAPGNSQVERLGASQGDIGRPLGVYIIQNGVALDCSAYSAELYILKPDGKFYTTQATVDSTETNLIKWETAKQETPVAGACAAQIRITAGDDDIGTARFVEFVEASPGDMGSASESEVALLTEYVRQARESATSAGRDATTASGAASSASGSASTASTAASTATQAASAAAAAADRAEEVEESIPEDYSQLSDDVISLKSAFAQLDANVITESAGPAPIVSIADGADGMPMRKVEVAIEPVQDLHGYEYPWPAGGGDNLLPPLESATQNSVTISVADDGTITLNGTASVDTYFDKYFDAFYSQGHNVYICGFNPVAGDSRLTIFIIGSAGNGQVNLATANAITSLVASADNTISRWRLRVPSGVTFTNFVIKPMLKIGGSAPTAFAPYSNVCPITGWTGAKVTRTGKNLWGGEKMADDVVEVVASSIYASKGSDSDGNFLSLTAGRQMSNKIYTKSVNFKANTKYTIVLKCKKSNGNPQTLISFKYTDGTSNNIRFPTNMAQDVIYTIIAESEDNKTLVGITGSYQSGTTYFYYENCGLFEGIITEDQFEPYQGQTYEVTFPDSAGTVYGGTLDVVSGKLVVDRELQTIDGVNIKFTGKYNYEVNSPLYFNGGNRNLYLQVDGPFSNVLTKSSRSASDSPLYSFPCGSGAIGTCSMIFPVGTEVADGNAWLQQMVQNGTPVQVVKLLANPQEITLSPTEIKTLLGINNVFADCGDTSIEYPANTKLYIDRKITEAVANALNA